MNFVLKEVYCVGLPSYLLSRSLLSWLLRLSVVRAAVQFWALLSCPLIWWATITVSMCSMLSIFTDLQYCARAYYVLNTWMTYRYIHTYTHTYISTAIFSYVGYMWGLLQLAPIMHMLIQCCHGEVMWQKSVLTAYSENLVSWATDNR